MNKLIIALVIASISYCSYESHLSRVEEDRKSTVAVLQKAKKEVIINKNLNNLIVELKADTVIVPFCKGIRSRNVMQHWPIAA